MNRLILGENLSELRKLRRRYRGRVRLIYIDPPFSTNQTFRISKGRAATISMGADSAVAYADTLTGSDYLDALKDRLEVAHDLLSDDGSLYLHIDCKVAYKLNGLLAGIFGTRNFRTSISRIKSNPKNFARRGYGNIKDTILFYTKSGEYVWNEPRISAGGARLASFSKEDANGRYTTTPIHAPGETRNGDTGMEWHGMKPPPGRHWRYSRKRLTELDGAGRIEWSSTGNPRLKIYAGEVEERGVLLQDIWEFKDPQYPSYPTEKNLSMLETIIRTSSNAGDIVLDFYCGSGTTLLAAAKNDRRFMGIDESKEAISVCRERLAGFKYEGGGKMKISA